MNRAVLRRFLILSIPVIVVLGTFIAFVIDHDRKDVIEHLRLHDQNIIKNNVERANSYFMNMMTDMDYLSAKLSNSNVVLPHNKEADSTLVIELINYQKSKRIFDQIRILDLRGVEIFRVNYNYGSPQRVPDSLLQDKSHRTYFNQVKKLSRGKIYVSPLDLNLEFGKVEYPLKPTLRMATALWSNDSICGYLVVNYLASRLLGNIKFCDNKRDQSKLFVFDHHGYYLYGVGADSLYGFIGDSTRHLNMQADNPDLWQTIKSSRAGQVISDNDLYTYAVADPDATYEQLLERKEPDLSDGINNNWYFVSLVTEENMLHLTRKNEHFIIGMGTILILIILTLSWLLSQSWIRERENHQRIVNKEMILSSQFKAIESSLLVISMKINGTIKNVNKNFIQTMIYKVDEIKGKQFGNLINTEYLGTAAYRSLWNDLKDGKYVGGHYPMINAKNQNLWLYCMFNPISVGDEPPHEILCLAIDSTKERQLEQEVKQQLNAINSGAIVSITDLEGNITYVNENFCAISKYNESELIGQNHRILKSGLQSDNMFKGMWKAITKGLIWRGEICNKASDGSFYWVDTTIAPFIGLDGQIEKYLSIRVDITAKKKNEEVIRTQTAELKAGRENLKKINMELEARNLAFKKSEEELLTVNKELESFSYTVSHDLRAPLRAIGGFADLLKAKHDDVMSEEGKRYIGIIRENVSRMGQLIDDLLQFSRLSRAEIKKVEVNMTELAQVALNELKNSNYNTEVVEIKDLGSVDCDTRMIRLVWLNLLSNALKYSTKETKPKVEIGPMPTEEGHTYYIKDNGVGFDMEFAEKLFEVFQRLHSPAEFEGTGIGLALVNRIINRHQGKIWAESKVGNGATFYFTLP